MNFTVYAQEVLDEIRRTNADPTEYQIAALTGISEASWVEFRNRNLGPKFYVDCNDTIRYPITELASFLKRNLWGIPHAEAP